VTHLAALDPALRTRLLRQAALAAGAPATDLSAAHVAGLDRLVTDWHGQGPLCLPGGLLARRRDGRIDIVGAEASGSPAVREVPRP
jgi:tRNA(Ile)-lysidine synthase